MGKGGLWIRMSDPGVTTFWVGTLHHRGNI